MSSAKYWVRGGGRWREIELDTGRVSGWGVASFVYVSRGKLVKGDKWRILRALRALAKGDTRGAARDGPRLTLKRSSAGAPPRKRKRLCHHHHCCSSLHSCHNQVNQIPNSGVLSALSSPTKTTANAVVQTDAKAIDKIDKVVTAQIHSRPSKRRHHLVISSDESEPPKLISRKKQKSTNYDRIVQELTDDTSEASENVRELFIEEEDVMTMRSCIERGIFPNDDLLMFDSSEKYQKQVIHKLNPLVLVNRCPKIARMLKANGNDQDDISLDDFISKLGLRHVRDVKERERYRFRNTISRKKNAPEDYTHKTDENDKENRSSTPMLKRQKRNLSLKRKEHNMKNAITGNTTPSLDKNRLTTVTEENLLPNRLRVQNRSITTSSDSNTDSDVPISSQKSVQKTELVKNKEAKVPNSLKDQNEIVSEKDSFKDHKSSPSKQAARSEMQKKIKLNKPSLRVNKPKVPVKSTREYSPAEDRAIVSWVQAGTRACKVNGNQLWRQLEPLFFGITGHVRSWHSLRNRYLRYILPLLQTLAPPHAATLRAAAAQGEMKFLRRRHSMFSPPRYGAASRKHAAGSKSPLRQVSSSVPEKVTTMRSTQSLDNTEKVLRARPSLNKSLNEQGMAKSNMAGTLKTPEKRKNLRSSRVATVSDTDTRASPKKVNTADSSKPKRRRLYNP